MSDVLTRSRLATVCALFCLCACRGPTDSPEVFCGGIAGIQCPGGGTCEDAPGDGCDPARGGADCGGVCRCLQLALCIQGFEFDSSPEVCACVPVRESPCALVDCRPGARCEVHDGEGICVSDGSLRCGDATCGGGQVCCNDSCGICTEVGGACIQLACEP